MEHVVIVGASLAGLRAAETLRSGGFEGRITMIGGETHHPYDRPPLSKRLLSGEWEPDRIALRKSDQMDGLDLHWRTGARAVGLDVESRTVFVGDGTHVAFDGLVIATGAEPRTLPAQRNHRSAHVLRTVDDALALRAELVTGGKRVVVIGAGFIGLEVAATARQLDNAVTVLEGAPAPLVRGLGAEMGAAVAAIHGDHGVEIRCDAAVHDITADSVVLADGTTVDADVLVVGIGVSPSVDWLDGSGLTIHDGVVCGPDLGVGHDGIFAAGDVARWHNQLFDEPMRVEHWTNAAEQGAHVGTNLLAWRDGEPTHAYAPVPFFWSEQYDRRIQFIGRPAGDDEVHVVAGSVDDRRFAAIYGSGGRLRGVLGVNMPRVVMPFRNHLEQRMSFDDAVAVAAELAA
ncbi:MAG: FAD-dependent oxidoreductase [Acidimicrobiaceae bacterium]|nr:FAD-dependent oxidoreductase [Acidimicrobiaceae bacterium]